MSRAEACNQVESASSQADRSLLGETAESDRKAFRQVGQTRVGRCYLRQETCSGESTTNDGSDSKLLGRRISEEAASRFVGIINHTLMDVMTSPPSYLAIL